MHYGCPGAPLASFIECLQTYTSVSAIKLVRKKATINNRKDKNYKNIGYVAFEKSLTHPTIVLTIKTVKCVCAHAIPV